MMKSKTVGVSPKLIAATVAAVVTYVLGQEVLDLPAWAVVSGQAVLVALAAFAASPGTVARVADDPYKAKAGERGQVEPLSLLIYVIVAIILIVVLFEVLDRL